MTEYVATPQRVTFADFETEVSVPLGELVTRVRRERRLSQREVQRRAGMKDATLSKIEKGINGISNVSIIIRLADALEMPREQLFEWSVRYIENKHRHSDGRAA